MVSRLSNNTAPMGAVHCRDDDVALHADARAGHPLERRALRASEDGSKVGVALERVAGGGLQPDGVVVCGHRIARDGCLLDGEISERDTNHLAEGARVERLALTTERRDRVSLGRREVERAVERDSRRCAMERYPPSSIPAPTTVNGGHIVVLANTGKLLFDVELPGQGTNGNGIGVPSAPTIADIDGDGQLEILVQTFEHGIDVFTVPGSGKACLPWGNARGSLLRNGTGPSTAK